MLFRNDNWYKKVKKLGMRPGVVGIRESRYLALVIVAEDPMDRATQNLFFKSLRHHQYNERTKEVVLTGSQVTLNISALYQLEMIELEDPTRLFDTSQRLRTAVRYFGARRVYNIDSDEIIGLGQGPSRSLDDVKRTFVLDLELRQGNIVPQCFSAPGCPGSFRHGNSLQLHVD